MIPDNIDQKLIMQGVHVDLTAALQNTIRERFGVLLRHNPWIVRINVRLHQDQKLGKGQQHHYTATGQIEIGGPDLVASAEGQAAYDALDALVGKLDRLLRDRAGQRKDKRNHPHEIELDAELPKTGPAGSQA
jgi:putative sigma-54 modulation protein